MLRSLNSVTSIADMDDAASAEGRISGDLFTAAIRDYREACHCLPGFNIPRRRCVFDDLSLSLAPVCRIDIEVSDWLAAPAEALSTCSSRTVLGPSRSEWRQYHALVFNRLRPFCGRRAKYLLEMLTL